MTCCDLGMHGSMNLMSVLILPSRMESRLLVEDVLVPELHGIRNLNCSVSILMWRKSAQEARIFLWITIFFSARSSRAATRGSRWSTAARPPTSTNGGTGSATSSAPGRYS